MSVGGYPLGAEYDARAPWNQKDDTECERCKGTGKIHYAIDVRSGKETEVTDIAYMILPDDEDGLQYGQHYIKGDCSTCRICNGDGYITEDDDRFDEVSSMERYYERKYGE